MADDKERNLRAVLETFEGTGTAVHAWRYSREDGAVSSFDRDKATELWLQIRPALQASPDHAGPGQFRLPRIRNPERLRKPVRVGFAQQLICAAT